MGIDGGIDQILTDLAVKESGGSVNGWPSDHPMIKGTFRVSSSGGASPFAGQPPSHTDGANHEMIASLLALTGCVGSQSGAQQSPHSDKAAYSTPPAVASML